MLNIICVNTLVAYAEDFCALWRAQSMPCWQDHAVNRYRKLVYLEKGLNDAPAYVVYFYWSSFFLFSFFSKCISKLCAVTTTVQLWSWHMANTHLSSYVVLVKRNAKPDAVMTILCQVALDACVVERERERERERELDADKHYLCSYTGHLCWRFLCIMKSAVSVMLTVPCSLQVQEVSLFVHGLNDVPAYVVYFY